MSIDHVAGFYVPWTLALAASTAEPMVAAPVVHFAGLGLPVVQSLLAVAGVLMARPLARKREAGLSLLHFAVVTVVMIVVALAWVAESRPGVLFTFVVAIGLGFSGYSLIETAGDEIQNFIRRVIAEVSELIHFGGKPK